ncbi:MAG: ABC transporter permease [Anaerolineae bacterium]|nr:ABC transporter permease [Anaerolineae bacterium]
MVKFAWRNLLHERTRLLISVAGIALAVALILLMYGIFAGSEEHAVIYIKNQPASIWMMQADVENIHMASSILPADAFNRVNTVEGVEQAASILYVSATLEIEDGVIASYLFGIDPAAPFGGPWSVVEGSGQPGMGEIVIDQVLAKRHGLGLGDTVKVMGTPLTIVGLSEGTLGIATNMVFVHKKALALAMGVSPESSSYILIQPAPGGNSTELMDRLRQAVPEANVITTPDFMIKEKDLIRQMGTDFLMAMSLVAYMIGLLVIGLTIYTMTLEHTREYGILKAIGAANRRVVSVVFIQAFVIGGIGYLLGILVTYGASTLINNLFPEMLILVEPANWLGKLPVLLILITLAAFAPLKRVIQSDPMVVFQA